MGGGGEGGMPAIVVSQNFVDEKIKCDCQTWPYVVMDQMVNPTKNISELKVKSTQSLCNTCLFY